MSDSERRGSGEGLWAIAPEDVRDWHREGRRAGESKSYCVMCKQDWPCDTVVVLADRDRLMARVAELEAGVGQIESLHWELSRAVGREGCVSQSHCENWPCPTHKIVMRLLLPEDLA